MDALTTLHYARAPGRARRRAAGRAARLRARAAALARAGHASRFADLRAATGADPDDLCEALRDGFLAELVMPHRSPLRRSASPRRRAARSPARSPAGRRATATDITSLAYTTVHMEEPAARLLLRLLDGTRDRAAIRAEFREQSGVELTPEVLDANLEALARLFLLTDR